jgi:hypothetical protein
MNRERRIIYAIDYDLLYDPMPKITQELTAGIEYTRLFDGLCNIPVTPGDNATRRVSSR